VVKNKKNAKKPNKAHELVVSSIQLHRHLSTDELSERHAAAVTEGQILEARVVRLQTELATAKNALISQNAILAGINICMERR
jgi:hypothetical protein